MKQILINLMYIPLFGCIMGLTGCIEFSVLPGRPLRIDGKAVMTEVYLGEGSHWADGQHPDTSHLDESTRLALEALWLQDARGEHASIPAFSRISWQLAAIGAPPELLEWAHKAALEEINHARLCFALAEGYGRCSYSVQPMPEILEKGFDLKGDPIDAIAKETIIDGCLTEGFFAELVTRASMRCEEPATLAALQQIAKEEKSHAQFSWALLAWLLKEHPAKVKIIIQNVADNLENYSCPKSQNLEQKRLIEKANPALLIKHGRVPEEQWQQVWDDHLMKTEQDLQKLLKSSA